MTSKLAVTALLALQLACPVAAEENIPKSQQIEATLDDDGKAFVSGSNAFSLDLYKASILENENLFLSPASVSLAMAMVYVGARGQTANEIRDAFHYPKQPETILAAAGPVLGTLAIRGEGRELKVANAWWIDKHVSLNPDYMTGLSTHMGASLRSLDFCERAEEGRQTINSWVATNTNHRIPELLPQGGLDGDTRDVLVNTIYWKGGWTHPFDKHATKIGSFTLVGGETRPASLMQQLDSFRVFDGEDVDAIELPYAGGEVSMVILLPEAHNKLTDFEAALTSSKLNGWLNKLDTLSMRRTLLTLPKMKLEQKIQVSPKIAALGVKTAFEDTANFSAVGNVVDCDGHDTSLKIRGIFHQAFLEVEELSTEAVAATAIERIITSGSLRPPPEPPFIFQADKPFLFLLRDTRTGLILFMGRYVEPGMAN